MSNASTDQSTHIDVIVPSSLTTELSKRLEPMAERLLVVRLQPLCLCCGEYIDNSQKQAWQCVGECCVQNENENITGVKKIDRPSVRVLLSFSLTLVHSLEHLRTGTSMGKPQLRTTRKSKRYVQHKCILLRHMCGWW
jgi:hypothetical protein